VSSEAQKTLPIPNALGNRERFDRSDIIYDCRERLVRQLVYAIETEDSDPHLAGGTVYVCREKDVATLEELLQFHMHLDTWRYFPGSGTLGRYVHDTGRYVMLSTHITRGDGACADLYLDPAWLLEPDEAEEA